MALKPRPGGSIKPFLRAAKRHVNPPFVVPVVNRGERGDGVDQQQRRMLAPGHGFADLADAARDPGRGLVVHDHDRLELVLAILAQTPLDDGRSTPCRQSPGTNSTSKPRRLAICCHSAANCPVSNISTLSPGESVLTSEASQAPVPDEGKIYDRSGALKDGFAPLENLFAQSGELGTAMIDGGALNRPQHPIGNIGRPRYLKEVTARAIFHLSLPNNAHMSS